MGRIDQSSEYNLKHTIRIELIRGEELLFNVDFETKEEFENFLAYHTDDLNEHSRNFISFYAIPDRMVFVRIRSIKRIIFCWDVPPLMEIPMIYQDNFGLASDFDGELLIPSAIFLLKHCKEPLVFDDLDPEDDFLNLDEESFENPHFLKGGFISMPDEDGEQNYIPVANIEYFEVDRCQIYPDQVWEEMNKPED